MSYPPHDPEKILVDYTLNGERKAFRVGMERLDELLAWANKEFGDDEQLVREDRYAPRHPSTRQR